jgi:hypothetical protein
VGVGEVGHLPDSMEFWEKLKFEKVGSRPNINMRN